uniref:Uncharacterized protein n=1 Tax=Molossus molossus TaxID=27622 RepID=A0A7J8IZ53_MOLMO|nr:hypothetical protein HJG59_010247 [Molossus molossus]
MMSASPWSQWRPGRLALHPPRFFLQEETPTCFSRTRITSTERRRAFPSPLPGGVPASGAPVKPAASPRHPSAPPVARSWAAGHMGEDPPLTLTPARVHACRRKETGAGGPGFVVNTLCCFS